MAIDTVPSDIHQPGNAECHMAELHALPSARFASPTALRRQQLVHDTAPIKFDSSPDGIWHMATGTVEQLLEAGLCTREHLPTGRHRKRCGRGGGQWAISLLPGGRAELKVWPGAADVQTRRRAIEDAEQELSYLPRCADDWRRWAVLGFCGDAIHACRDRGGFRLNAEDRVEIERLQRCIDHAKRRIEQMLSVARVDFDRAAHEQAMAELQERIDVASKMPPAPPLGAESGEVRYG